ncbi:MAG: helix-turn-helix domain-containing protein [Pseudomonadota bacterium]
MNTISAINAKCSQCSFKRLCLAQSLDEAGLVRLDEIIGKRRRVLRDERLYRVGQPFTKLYAVHFGHFKTAHLNRQGEQRITSFAMSGELLGLSGIGTGLYGCDAVALEDSEVCEIPYERLGTLLADMPQLMMQFHRLMSQEILREQAAMLFLGNMAAEQRLATFLLNLATRYAQRGFSSSAFQLRMSREDIGAFLGLTIESISRLLARFRNNGWIRLANRDLEILDRAALEACLAGSAGQPRLELLAA